MGSAAAVFTPEWLTVALREGGLIGSPAVASVHAHPIGVGKGVMARCYRLTLGYDPPAPDAPTTLIAKVPQDDPTMLELATNINMYEREVLFYQQIASTSTMRVPHCYYSFCESTSGGFVLLLEDLTSARPGDPVVGGTEADARLAIKEVAKLHAGWWGRTEGEGLAWMPTLQERINWLLARAPGAWGGFSERYAQTLAPSAIALAESVVDEFAAVPHTLSASHQTLVHYDYHLDNMFFDRASNEPRVTVIDWATVVRGSGAFDVAYFLTSSLDIDTRRACEADLLREYWDRLIEIGVRNYTFPECRADYLMSLKLCLLRRVVVGSTMTLPDSQVLSRQQAWLDRLVAAVADNH